MARSILTRRLVLAGLGVLAATPVRAHHGWAWTGQEPFELSGTIVDIYLGNPHGHLDLDAEGQVWRVELAPPSANRRAGFTEDAAAVGDAAQAFGFRSLRADEARMKAVRIEVRGARYDIYPQRTRLFDA